MDHKDLNLDSKESTASGAPTRVFAERLCRLGQLGTIRLDKERVKLL